MIRVEYWRGQEFVSIMEYELGLAVTRMSVAAYGYGNWIYDYETGQLEQLPKNWYIV